VTRAERAARVCEILARTYPQAHCELDYTTPLELLIATILSAQCTDKRGFRGPAARTTRGDHQDRGLLPLEGEEHSRLLRRPRRAARR
jgi:hypothetical protein